MTPVLYNSPYMFLSVSLAHEWHLLASAACCNEDPEFAYTARGLVLSLVVGTIGTGGGSLVISALTLLGISPAVAVGTDLALA